MSTYKNFISFFVLLLLVSCSVPKQTADPTVDAPQSYRQIQSDTATVASIPWNQYFADPRLKELLSEAIAHNNDLQIALKNIESAKLILTQSKWGNIPTLDLMAGVSTTRLSDNSISGFTTSNFLGLHHIEDYNVAARISWEADIWGKIKERKAASLAGYLQSEEAKRAVQTQIVSDVAKAYYNLLLLDRQLDIARKNIALNDSTLSIIKLQYSSGLVTSLAVQQATALKLNISKLVPFFEQEIYIQENALSILTGKAPEKIDRIANLEEIKIDRSLSAGLPSTMLSLRPDVKFQELALSKANAEMGYARANMYPSLTITAQAGLNSFQSSNWFNIPASLFGAVGGSLTQPLFHKKELRTQYELAKVRREQEVIAFRQSVLVAVGEVSDALVKLEKLEEQEGFAVESVVTLQKATSNSKLLFQNGMADYLEVITAQSKVLESELDLAQIKKSRLDATVDIYRAAGGGWR